MENPNKDAYIKNSPRIDYGSTITQDSYVNQSVSVVEPQNAFQTNFDVGATNNSNSVGADDYQNCLHSSTQKTSLISKSPKMATAMTRLDKMSSDPLSSSRSAGGSADASQRHTNPFQNWEQNIHFFLNVLNQIFIGFVTLYMSWQCLHLSLAKTALHAWLVTIGFSFLMAEAIMCHYTGNVLTFSYKRTTKTKIHWILQVLGGSLGLIGTLVKMVQKGFLLYTRHGKLGFAAFILCLISLLSGLCALYSQRVKRFATPLLNKTFHNCLGLTTFIIAMLAQYYGYETGFFYRLTTHDLRVLIRFITLLSLVLTCIGPVKALYQKIYSIVRQFS